jgi:hypothetical protein
MRNYLLFSMLCVQVFLHAQKVITGIVTDETGAGLEFAAVQLKSLPDSVVIAQAWSEQNGAWSVSMPSAGAYLIEVELLGYQTFWTEVKGIETAPLAIHLQAETKVLTGVTITANTALITKKADRTIVNIDAMLGVEGQSAVEVLERSPGVLVETDGTIKLKGRAGVQIFIDEKPTYLSGDELTNYLRSLPAGTLKSIEIIPNPPAKYEAAGNAGIINIITKKERSLGYTGNVQLAGYQGRYTRSNTNGSLNFNSKRFGVFTNFGYRTVTGFHDLTIYRYYKNPDGTAASSFVQNSYLKWAFGTPSGRISFDYYLTPRTTMGATIRGVYNPQEHITTSQSRIGTGQTDILTNTVQAENRSKRNFTNGTYHLNFRHQFPREGWSLNADADMATYHTTNDLTTSNLVYLADGSTLLSNDGLLGKVPSDLKIYAFKSDFSRPLQAGTKLDMGIKSAFTRTDNLADYLTRTPDTTFRNNDLTNQFLYDEWINAAYLNVSQSIENWEIQLGFRLEKTDLTGNQLGNEIIPAQTFKRDYLSLFPTLFLSYKADTLDHHLWSFNYGRRIDRPFFQDLNPFISPLDKFTYYTGNPNLVPTFSHNFSLAHTFLSKLTTTLTYAITLDGINETLEIRENGIYYSRPGNVSRNNLFNLSLEGSIPVRKWWTATFYAEAGHQQFDSKLYTETLASRGNYWLIQGTQQFPLPKDWTLELIGNYQSRYVYAQLLLGNVGQVGLGASKRIFKNKGSLKLSASDLFFTNQPFGTINNLRLTDARWTGFLDSRGATLSFSYRFGKPLKGAKGKYDGSGSGDEQKRVKGG